MLSKIYDMMGDKIVELAGLPTPLTSHPLPSSPFPTLPSYELYCWILINYPAPLNNLPEPLSNPPIRIKGQKVGKVIIT